MSLPKFEVVWSVKTNRPCSFRFVKGYIPQDLFGPFLNTLSHTFRKAKPINHVQKLIKQTTNIPNKKYALKYTFFPKYKIVFFLCI